MNCNEKSENDFVISLLKCCLCFSFVCAGVSCKQTYLFPCQECEDFPSGVNNFSKTLKMNRFWTSAQLISVCQANFILNSAINSEEKISQRWFILLLIFAPSLCFIFFFPFCVFLPTSTFSLLQFSRSVFERGGESGVSAAELTEQKIGLMLLEVCHKAGGSDYLRQIYHIIQGNEVGKHSLSPAIRWLLAWGRRLFRRGRQREGGMLLMCSLLVLIFRCSGDLKGANLQRFRVLYTHHM